MKCYRNLARERSVNSCGIMRDHEDPFHRNVGRHTQQPWSTHHASAWLTLAFVTRERRQLDSTGSRTHRCGGYWAQSCFLAQLHTEEWFEKILRMCNKCGFCCPSELTVLSEGIFVLGEQQTCHPEQIPPVFTVPGFLYGFLPVITHLCTSRRFVSNQAMGERYVKTVLTK